MISLKKGLCALGFGIGLSVTLSAWAIPPDCGVCGGWYQKCLAGDNLACERYDTYACSVNYPDCTG